LQEVKNPYALFLGLDGLALQLGYVYIGLENQDPETSPKSIFWDEAGTEVASQPIRTLAGMADRSGSPARFYTSGKYSIRVRDAQGTQVFYEASAGEDETVSAGDPYYVHVSFLGDAPTTSQVIGKHVFGVAVSFDADLPDAAYFHAGTNPASDCVLAMKANGTSFGTLTITTTGTLLVDCNAQDFDIGDRFELVAPGSTTTCANIAGTITGFVV
jgi:hypothetical protein